jgi:hypothetical protein
MFSILAFGLLSGYLLLDILVGLVGSRRNIGFGWAFIISVLFSPIVGLLIALISPALPAGAEPKYGCLGQTFGCLGTLLIILIVAALLFGAAALFLPMA